MTRRTTVILAAVALAVLVAVVTAVVVVSRDVDRRDAIDQQHRHERDRDAVLEDVHREEHELASLRSSLGRSAVPVRSAPIDAPEGVEETLFTGKLAIGDFHDVFVDEGIVLTGIDAHEVDQVEQRPEETVPPRPRKPLRPDTGYRLVQVDLLVTNRTGDGADPACGISSEFNAAAITDTGERALVLESYPNVDTYPTSCGDGLADGESGRIALAVGMREGDKLKALEFSYLGEKSDQYTQAMVLRKAV